MELIEKFGIDVRTLIAQIVNFLIVLLVLYRFAFKPVLKLLDDRAKKIKISLQHAQEVERKMQELDALKNRMLQEVEQKSQMMLKTTQEKADQERQFIVNKAKNEVKDIIEKAQQEIQITRKNLLDVSKNDIVAVIVTSLEKILPKKIDHAFEKEMITSVIDMAIDERKKQL
jgi:F-type H+-transporting ATPase subunit b